MNGRKLLHDHFAALLESARRFPLALFFGVAGALFASLDVARADAFGRWNEPVSLLNAAHRACWLGIPLAFALALLAEASGFGRRGKSAGALLALAITGLIAAYFHGESRQVFGLRYVLWMTASVAVAMTVPLLARRGPERYRRFNTVLLQRVLTAYALVIPLAGGLCLGLWSVEKLFDLKIDADVYLIIWYGVAGVFGTAYFTGTAPRLGDDARENPAFLHGLTRFILLPLSITYLLILYAYGVRLAALREWPEGTLSRLILALAVAGVITHLLVQDRDEDRGLGRWYAKAFYPLLLPLALLLSASIWRRTAEYGFTESRLLVWLAAAWMTAAALYFTLFSRARAAAIPATVGVVALLASVGPWSVFEVSLRSQLDRLEGQLQASGRFREGHLVRSSAALSKNAEAEISQGLIFLEERGALARLKPWFAPGDASCADCLTLKDSVPAPQSLALALGVPWRPYAAFTAEQRQAYIADEAAFSVQGYAVAVPFELDAWLEEATLAASAPGRGEYFLEGDSDQRLAVRRGNTRITSIDLTPLAARTRADSLSVRGGEDRVVPADSLRLDWEDARGRYSLRATRLGVESDGRGRDRIYQIRGLLLIAPAR